MQQPPAFDLEKKWQPAFKTIPNPHAPVVGGVEFGNVERPAHDARHVLLSVEQRVACDNSGFKMARSVRMERLFIIFVLKLE